MIDGDGVVISTGQQAALFGGPLYTLVKALSALALADVLEREMLGDFGLEAVFA